MDINQDFFNYLEPYLIKLREKVGPDFVVFGSAPLYLLGIVEFNGKINDLDINLTDPNCIPKEALEVTFHKDQKQKLYKIMIADLEIDIGVSWPGYENFLKKIKSNPIVIAGFKFANLDIVEEWKKEMVKRYDRQKDKDYLQKINNWRVLSALKTFYNLIDNQNIKWILSGSTSLFIQGVDVVISNDIDILTDESGATALDKLLSAHQVKPMSYSETDKYKSYFGVYQIDQTKLEIMGDFQYRLNNGSWSEVNQNNEVVFKTLMGMKLPLLKLEQELIEYENMGRADKAEKIKEALKNKQ
ncbi:MAG: hypothetical protein WC564_02025 [Patescibacteria group bacterium]|jgi:hypothetical protein